MVDGFFKDGWVCCWLCWKMFYFDCELDFVVFDMVDGFVWCVYMMNCFGFDGEVVGYEFCGQEWGCYELLILFGLLEI